MQYQDGLTFVYEGVTFLSVYIPHRDFYGLFIVRPCTTWEDAFNKRTFLLQEYENDKRNLTRSYA